MTRPPVPAGEARLDELEAKLAFIDDLLETLNRTVYRQQQQIDQLAQAVGALRQQVRDAPTAPAADPRAELPPHY